jgi:hypothetical protein
MQDLAPRSKFPGSHQPATTPPSLSYLRRTLSGEDQRVLEGLLILIRRRFPCDPVKEELTTFAYGLMMSLIKQVRAREHLQRLTDRITGAPIHPPFP